MVLTPKQRHTIDALKCRTVSRGFTEAEETQAREHLGRYLAGLLVDGYDLAPPAPPQPAPSPPPAPSRPPTPSAPSAPSRQAAADPNKKGRSSIKTIAGCAFWSWLIYAAYHAPTQPEGVTAQQPRIGHLASGMTYFVAPDHFVTPTGLNCTSNASTGNYGCTWPKYWTRPATVTTTWLQTVTQQGLL